MLPNLSLLTLLSAAVSASPLLDARAPAAALDERAVTVTSGDLNNFKFFIQWVEATSCNSDIAPTATIACGADACPLIEANRARVVNTFSGDLTGVAGFVATDPVRKNIVVATRSSHNIRNWITNIFFGLDSCDFVDGCKIHSGFSEAWDEIRDDVLASVRSARAANPGYAVVAVGHSLGGAIATVAAADLRRNGFPTDIYTFGSPRVGNDDFVNFVTDQPGAEYRITHVDDPVPRLPPIFLGYRHTSPEYWLSTGGTTTVDYTVADIKVCEGDANTNCNAGTLGLNTDAHNYYLMKTGLCGDGDKLGLRDEEVSDDDLEARLKLWAQMDAEFSSSNHL